MKRIKIDERDVGSAIAELANDRAESEQRVVDIGSLLQAITSRASVCHSL